MLAGRTRQLGLRSNGKIQKLRVLKVSERRLRILAWSSVIAIRTALPLRVPLNLGWRFENWVRSESRGRSSGVCRRETTMNSESLVAFVTFESFGSEEVVMANGMKKVELHVNE